MGIAYDSRNGMSLVCPLCKVQRVGLDSNSHLAYTSSHLERQFPFLGKRIFRLILVFVFTLYTYGAVADVLYLDGNRPGYLVKRLLVE